MAADERSEPAPFVRLFRHMISRSFVWCLPLQAAASAYTYTAGNRRTALLLCWNIVVCLLLYCSESSKSLLAILANILRSGSI